MITLFDACYGGNQAAFACIALTGWSSDRYIHSQTCILPVASPYIPGAFFKRELPGILRLCQIVIWPLDVLVVDGYVHLPGGRPGLGGYLHVELQRPVVGIAKNPYAGLRACIPVYRGGSRKPLFVTAAGMDVEQAAEHVQAMAGSHRIPLMVKTVDRLAKERMEQHHAGA